jgi:hypothetical protein
MAGRGGPAGSDGCGGEEAEVDAAGVAGCGCEAGPLHPRSHAIIKTDEKIVFKSGFIHTTLTHAL